MGPASLDRRSLHALSGELAAEHELAERLRRCLRTEVEKRKAAQHKGRRLQGQRLSLECEVAALRVKRRRTARLVAGLRWLLKTERRVAGELYRESSWHQTVAETMTDSFREATFKRVDAEVELERIRPAYLSALLQMVQYGGLAHQLRRAAATIAHLTVATEEGQRLSRSLREQLAREGQERDAAQLEAAAAAERAHALEHENDELQRQVLQLGTQMEEQAGRVESAVGRAEAAEARVRELLAVGGARS